MKITRDDILDAIEQEPLQAGKWIDIYSDKPLTECPVCIVGALLRRAGTELDARVFMREGERVTLGRFYDDAVRVELDRENWLGALSIYFEKKCYGRDVTSRDRDDLRKFVLTHFPIGIVYSDENPSNDVLRS